MDGKGIFNPGQDISESSENVFSVYAADLDNDGDMDALSVSFFDNIVAWYENLTITTSIKKHETKTPKAFHLNQNYPNPFNPSTTIKYTLSESDKISLTIYNIIGQKIVTLVNEYKHPGEHEIRWKPKGLHSGIYFYKLQLGNGFVETKKMILQIK